MSPPSRLPLRWLLVVAVAVALVAVGWWLTRPRDVRLTHPEPGPLEDTARLWAEGQVVELVPRGDVALRAGPAGVGLFAEADGEPLARTPRWEPTVAQVTLDYVENGIDFEHLEVVFEEPRSELAAALGAAAGGRSGVKARQGHRLRRPGEAGRVGDALLRRTEPVAVALLVGPELARGLVEHLARDGFEGALLLYDFLGAEEALAPLRATLGDAVCSVHLATMMPPGFVATFSARYGRPPELRACEAQALLLLVDPRAPLEAIARSDLLDADRELVYRPRFARYP
ncbi:MAG: hypothetical protein R3B72_41535 [Polyangiaceae bacterium]